MQRSVVLGAYPACFVLYSLDIATVLLFISAFFPFIRELC